MTRGRKYMAQLIMTTDSPEMTAKLFGSFDVNARILEEAFGVSISNRPAGVGGGDNLIISGEDEISVGMRSRHWNTSAASPHTTTPFPSRPCATSRT